MNEKKLQKKLESLVWMRMFTRGVNVFGFVASGAGNVLHARKTPTGIAIALAAPVIVMLGFELVTRIPLRKEASWWWKGLLVLATAAIASIMALISYFHQRDAFYAETGDQLQAWLLPVAIDGLMIVGAVSLIELGIQIRDLEAVIEAGGAQVAKPKPIVPPKDRPLSKKEQIAQIVARSPELDAKKVAELTGASLNYASDVIKALRQRAQEEVDQQQSQDLVLA